MMNGRLSLQSLFFSIIFFTHCSSPEPRQIIFLPQNPVIDGKLDGSLKAAPPKSFNHIWQFNNPITDTVPVTYSIAYTPTHLYLYLESESDSINYRPRGFINGDGFKFLIGNPQEGGLTNEYYEMVFSPSKDKSYWARKRIWEYNHDQSHGKSFSESTLFEEVASDGICGFEALIAWEDIEPYHPWFMEEIGYNLYFAKAIGDTITNGYAVVGDEGIWDEELPKRAYQLVDFEVPNTVNDPLLQVRPAKRHLSEGELLIIKAGSIARQKRTQKVKIALVSETGESSLRDDFEVLFRKTFSTSTFELETKSLKPGKYALSVFSDLDTLWSKQIVLFPRIDFTRFENELKKNEQELSLGVVNTLMFKLHQLQKMLKELKSYESGADIFDDFLMFEKEFSLFNKGVDPYQDITAPYRRAFRSAQDGTYQPYTLQLPEQYDPAKKYPLLVFLHGSGQDEQGILNQARSGGAFIELAPLARDIYYCYSSDSSQTDIVEAIEDVIQNFSVDKEKIVIGGFSMGGYGALRTYYEHPDLYKGVAVFAGHPHLASNWLDGEHPDFLMDKYLTGFSNIPIFIYHGKKDGSLPVQKAEELIKQLKEAGALVTASIVEEKGHQYPDEETNELYFKWLMKVME